MKEFNKTQFLHIQTGGLTINIRSKLFKSLISPLDIPVVGDILYLGVDIPGVLLGIPLGKVDTPDRAPRHIHKLVWVVPDK